MARWCELMSGLSALGGTPKRFRSAANQQQLLPTSAISETVCPPVASLTAQSNPGAPRSLASEAPALRRASDIFRRRSRCRLRRLEDWLGCHRLDTAPGESASRPFVTRTSSHSRADRLGVKGRERRSLLVRIHSSFCSVFSHFKGILQPSFLARAVDGRWCCLLGDAQRVCEHSRTIRHSLLVREALDKYLASNVQDGSSARLCVLSVVTTTTIRDQTILYSGGAY